LIEKCKLQLTAYIFSCLLFRILTTSVIIRIHPGIIDWLPAAAVIHVICTANYLLTYLLKPWRNSVLEWTTSEFQKPDVVNLYAWPWPMLKF